MISVSNICKRYGNVEAAAGVSFDVEDGRITTLLGLNGSGKSTTLRAISGTLTPDEGSVAIDGADPARDPGTALRQLGFFPDRFGLYPRLTVREHLMHLARVRQLRSPEMLVQWVTERTGLHEILDRRTAGFSEGQRMRTGLAMALLHDPQNVVLDEPTRGLDVAGVRSLRDLLRHLKEQGRAVLFTSHVLAEVEELADTVVVLRRGRVVAIDTPTALRGSTSLEEAVIQLMEEAA